MAPPALGRMGRKLPQILQMPVEQRHRSVWTPPGEARGVGPDARCRAVRATGAPGGKGKENQAPYLFLDRLLQAEQNQLEERRIAPSSRDGPGRLRLPAANRKRRIQTLDACAWIRSHEMVLFQGPPGKGKTHLAVALGLKTVENGFSVAFYRLDDLLHAMKQDAEVPPAGSRERSTSRPLC